MCVYNNIKINGCRGYLCLVPDLLHQMAMETLWIWSVDAEYCNMFVFNVLFWQYYKNVKYLLSSYG